MDPNRVSFIKSASRAVDFPDSPLPQIAVAGRSNVGKSSLINCLFGRKRLARVSSTPGATRLINFFLVKECFWLTDLPGYGYAKRSKTERRAWGNLVNAYLAQVETLRAMFVLIDIRRGAGEFERQLLETLAELDIVAPVVLTKADKLPKHKRGLEVKRIRRELSGQCPWVLPFSSKSGQGRTELWSVMEGFAADIAPPDG